MAIGDKGRGAVDAPRRRALRAAMLAVLLPAMAACAKGSGGGGGSAGGPAPGDGVKEIERLRAQNPRGGR